MTTFTFAIHRWKAIDLRLNLAPSYQDLKHPTSRQNFYDTLGQIPELIPTLRHTSKFTDGLFLYNNHHHHHRGIYVSCLS